MEKINVFIDYIHDVNSDRLYIGSVVVGEGEYQRLNNIFKNNFPNTTRGNRKDKNYVRKMKDILAELNNENEVVVYNTNEKYSSVNDLNPIEACFDNYLRKLGDKFSKKEVEGVIYYDWNLPISKVYYIPKGMKLKSSNEEKVLGIHIADFLTWGAYIKERQETIYKRNKEKLVTFQEWIKRFPLLGASDPQGMGRSIIEAVKKKVIPIVQIDSEVWFRVREVSSSKVFNVEDMHAPKPEYVRKEGRYNHIGIPVFYLSSDLNTSIAEIMEVGDERLLWSQKFKLNGLKVLDLTVHHDSEMDIKQSELELLIAALLHEGVVDEDIENRDTPLKPEYYIPRFVADVAKAYGEVDGIRYNSNRGTGFNLALFSWEGKVDYLDIPLIGKHVRKELFNEVVIQTPPWQKNLWDMTCTCGNTISQLQKICPHCGKPNHFYMMDDDI